MNIKYSITLVALVFVACAGAAVRTPVTAVQPPAQLLGAFDDDYNSKFTLSATEFFQRPRNRFHIVRWDTAGQYFIAHNDSLNPSAANRWTRVDYMILADMAPYIWGFCFSAYEAPTQAAAEAAAMAKRDTPRTGCNGFPFTRMKPAAP